MSKDHLSSDDEAAKENKANSGAEDTTVETADEKPTVSEPVVEHKPKKVKTPWSKRKKLLIFGLSPLLLIIILAIIAVLPMSYPLWSFKHQPASLSVSDADYKSALDNVGISLDGQKLTFKDKQPYNFSVQPGSHKLIITKQYYETSNTTFTVKPFGGQKLQFDIKLKPTGRPVVVQLQNTITKEPLNGAKITLDKAKTETDKDGKARLIVPAGKDTVDIKVSKDGFFDANQKVTVVVSADKAKVDPKNIFNLVPNGKVYFLSKRTGKIDLMKSNLDGSGQSVVMAGTGKESNTDTILLSSRDWKYLVLKSTRDSIKPKLYLIETSNDKVTTIDEGDADFQVTGWHDHIFVYNVIRNVTKQPEHYRLKAYNAETNSLKILDKSGYVAYNGYGPSLYGSYSDGRDSDEAIERVSLAGNQVLYSKYWIGSGDTNTLQTHKFMSINFDGSNQKTIAEADYRTSGSYSFHSISPYEFFVTVYTRVDNTSVDKNYIYNATTAKLTETTDKAAIAKYNNSSSPTYLLSPSGKKTFWSDPRDGKNTLLVGDEEAENEKEIATGSEYDTYGWYSDNYLLLSKKGSELYIAGPNAKDPVKITDYHKPEYRFEGYGGGYGGR